ncbi:MAG: adenine phosphoribosyltransferase [Candidatus Lokiarchaeota archaeon]|nr:adenine phosphoribosyltransferase [Candidatus Lokiarchaeota archaeon]
MVNLLDYIRTVEGFPKEGISFKDITTLAKKHTPFKESCDRIIQNYKDRGITKVAAIEARGYIWGGVIAYQLGAGFILIRKPGKLPADIIKESYELEYGTDTIEMHKDAIEEGDKVLLFDDLLATGGTAKAAVNLIEKAGGNIEGIAFVIELTGSLHGRDKLEGHDVFSLLDIPVDE